MNRPVSLRVGETLIQTLWVGGLWTVGYLVAPALFARLDDTRLAGELAGGLFDLMAWISIACGLLLIAVESGSGRPAAIRRLRRWLSAVMMACLAMGVWGLRPWMQAARLADGSPGEGFALLHGVSAVLYLVASLSGILLVASSAFRVSPSAE
jgi:hypothetical protein